MKHLLQKSSLLGLSLAVGLFVLPSAAQATGIVATGGNVTVTFGGSDAGYTSTLYLGDKALFSNRDVAGSTINLGNFEAGTELNFRLEVHNTGMTFFTGSGANNIDGIAHAAVTALGDSTMVGWEDMAGGGDRDYNDLIFTFTNTGEGGENDVNQGIINTDPDQQGKLIENPEPATIVLFGSGLLGLGAWRLRKKQV